MVFKSDVSVQRGGFAATHSTGKIFKKLPIFEVFSYRLNDSNISACGGHLTATSRVKHFYSHAKFGGFDYDNNADCDWAIEAEPGRNVQLTFLTFDVRIFLVILRDGLYHARDRGGWNRNGFFL